MIALISASAAIVAALASSWLTARHVREATELQIDAETHADRTRALRDERRGRTAYLRELLRDLSEAAAGEAMIAITRSAQENTMGRSETTALIDRMLRERLLPADEENRREVIDLVLQQWRTQGHEVLMDGNVHRLTSVLVRLMAVVPPGEASVPWNQFRTDWIRRVMPTADSPLAVTPQDLQALAVHLDQIHSALDSYVVGQ
ncbi:MAG: hypothetical protein U0446_03230 [Dehalococcoidia bacterium]